MRRLAFVVVAGCGRLGFDSPGGDASNLDDAGESVYRTAVLGDRPVAYWRLGEPSGTVARDDIGTLDGTWSGTIVRVPGATNDGDLAVKLDGMTARCEIGDVLAFPGTAPHTIELWAMREMIDDSVRWMVHRSTLAAPEEGWQLYTGQSFLLYSRLMNDSESGYASAPEFEPGVWRHVVATYDGTESALYVDGVYSGGMSAGPISNAGGLLAFGDRVEQQFFKYDGILDEIAIYDRALTPATIRAHYAASGR